MTEKEKVKAYDEAIERVKKSYGNIIAEEIFPELKESDDEKIRKEIISILRNAYWTSNRNRFNELVAWLEKQRDKDKLIKELGEYKVKYTQEVLEKYVNSMSDKDDERLRKTAIAFLKDFAEQGYENAVECIAWLEKQGEQASSQTNERAWIYLVSDVLTWKDGIGQYLDDPRVQELAKRLCSKYSQKLYNSSKFALENQWISVKEDLPCNHDSLLIRCLPYINTLTKPVLTLVDDGSYQVCEMFINEEGIWEWSYNGTVICWSPIPEPPKE